MIFGSMLRSTNNIKSFIAGDSSSDCASCARRVADVAFVAATNVARVGVGIEAFAGLSCCIAEGVRRPTSCHVRLVLYSQLPGIALKRKVVKP